MTVKSGVASKNQSMISNVENTRKTVKLPPLQKTSELALENIPEESADISK